MQGAASPPILSGAAPVRMYAASPSLTQRYGLLFEEGEYPDKGVTVTKADLDRWVANHRPAPLMIEHRPCPLDGRLKGFGLVERPEVRYIPEKGIHGLFGKVDFPTVLDELLGEGPRKVSLGIEADLSAIREISSVNDPRVADAAVFHDRALAAFAAADLAESDSSLSPSSPAHRSQDPNPYHEPIMDFKTWWSGLTPENRRRSGISDEQAVVFASSAPAATPPPPVRAERGDEAREARIAELEARIMNQSVGFARSAAEAFYLEQLTGRKAVPAMRAALESVFAAALRMDGGGQIRFSSDGRAAEGEVVRSLRDLFETMPILFHTASRLPSVAASEPPAQEFTDAQIDRALGLSPASAGGRG